MVVAANQAGNTDFAAAAQVTQSIMVNKAVLTVTAANASRVYGTANPSFTDTITGFVNGDTAATAITGTPSLTTAATALSPVASYAITSAAGTLAAASYTFTYVNGTLTIGQAVLTVTPTNASRAYGAANPAFTGIITGLVTGDNITATYASGATATTPAGVYATGVNAITATLSDQGNRLGNYTVTLTLGTLTITQSSITLSCTPTAITYGTALSVSQLGCSSGGVAGSYTLTPAAGTVLTAGSQSITVSFAPTDGTDYSTATTTATLQVNQAVPVITWTTPAAITAGSALGTTQLDATASVPGTFAYTPAAGAVLAAGSQTLSVAFTPTDTTDYTSATTIVPLTINPTTQCAASYQRAITIDHTKVPNTDQVNFPFLFSTTDQAFATIANGGHIASPNGNDIIFSTDPNGLTKLDYELEQYNPITGQIVAWIRIPTLSHTTNTVIYMFYGNSSITTSLQNPAGVWDTNYHAVYHLANVGTSTAADSTANGNNASLTSVSAAFGEIDGAANFNGISSYMQVPSAAFGAYPNDFTASFGVWFMTAAAGVILGQTGGGEPGSSPDGWVPALYVDTAGSLRASLFWHGGVSDQIVTTTAYNDNNWHYAVDTFANGTETLYVDGQNTGSQQAGEDGYASSYEYFVGAGETANWPAANGSWLYFNGLIDEVNISNSARSSDWVLTEYNNQSSPAAFYQLSSESLDSTPRITPAAVNLYATQNQQFTLLGMGTCSSAAINWAIEPAVAGAISQIGLYASPSSIIIQQIVTVTATSTANNSPVSATVTLMPSWSGPAGTVITINGTGGFGSAEGASSVTVGGLPAVTLFWSDTQIQVQIPTGTELGLNSVVIAVAGQPDTKATFNVTPGIVGITPSSAGTTASTTINTPNQIAPLIFNGATGQLVDVSLLNSTFNVDCNSARVTILNPVGSTLFSQGFCNGSTTNPITLPFTGTYTLIFAPNSNGATGSATVTLWVFNNLVSTIASGIPVPVTINYPGQEELLTFSGIAGQVATASLSNSTFSNSYCNSSRIYFIGPDGTLLSNQNICSGITTDRVMLPTTGTYTLIVFPGGGNGATGSATVTLWVFNDQVSTTKSGIPVPVTINYPGQEELLTFSGIAGQVATASLSNATFSGDSNCAWIRFINLDGSILSNQNICSGITTNRVMLPVTGTYTLTVFPGAGNGATGSATVTLWVFNDQVSKVLLSTGSVSVAPSSATLGEGHVQQFSAKVLNISNPAVNWSLSPSGMGTISTTGLYTAPSIVSSPEMVTITATSQASSGVFGIPVPVIINFPGQEELLTFSGIAGQVATTSLSNATFSGDSDCAWIRFINPDDSILINQNICSGSTTENVTLPTTGTYTLIVFPGNNNGSIGSATVLLTTKWVIASQSASSMIQLTPQQCGSNGYGYQRAITIDHTKVPNSDQINFPFLFNTTDPLLATTANGGHVTNFSGYDIIFTSDPAGQNILDYEMEEYDPIHGQVIAWVRIPTLSHVTDTVIYMFYGNSSITTSQQNPTSVWDTNYKAVYHLASVGAGVAADSTANGNSGALTSVSGVSGEIDGAASFNGASSFLQIPSADFASYPASGSTVNGFSASFGVWFQTVSAGVILGQTDGTAPGGQPGQWQPALYIDNAGLLRTSLFSHGGVTDQIVTATPYNDNKWHLAVDTYSDDTEELYIDGQFIGAQPVAELGYNTVYSYFIGAGETANWPASNGAWLYFNGALDEISVSNIARSSDWIQTEYNNQSSPSTFYALHLENTEEVSPSTVSLIGSQNQQFSVIGSEAGSCNSPVVIWSMPSGSRGTLSASGLYTAPASIETQQTVTITAITLGATSASYSGTITLMPPVTVSVTPPSAAISSGQTQQFSASVSNTSNTAVIWTISPAGMGTISASGLYTAPMIVTAQQTVNVIATSLTDPTKSASATITLAGTVTLPPVSINVTPTSAALYGNQTQQFTANVSNTYNTAVTWSLSPSGVGTLSSSGLYTAPAMITTQQTVTITATSLANPTQSVSAIIALSPTPCGTNGYGYQRTIVIDHSKVPNTDQTNFPFLFNTTDPLLATTANGGHVNNPNGYDIIFASDPAGQNILNYEMEQYNPSTGQIIAWVSVPTLSHTTNTVIYMFYGNLSINTSQQHQDAVWSSNYVSVWHLANGVNLSTEDSTANDNVGVIEGASATEGEIDGAAALDGVSAKIALNASGFPSGGAARTISVWFKANAFPNNYNDVFSYGTPSQDLANGFTVHQNSLYFFGYGDDFNSNTVIKPNKWYYAVGTFDGANADLYINGALDNTAIKTTWNTAGSKAYIGEQINDASEYFDGVIDEVRITNSVQTSDWIATEYSNQSSPSTFYVVSSENGFVVSPAIAALNSLQSLQLTATSLCNSVVAWSMPVGSPGTLTPSGLYTAPAIITTQQTLTITGASQTATANSSTATITLMPPVAVSMTPASITLTGDQTQQFIASVSNTNNTAVTWTINPSGVGTISADGVYMAPSTITTPQTVTIIATSQEDSTKSASATITLSLTQCASSGYAYQRVIIIDHTKVPNSDQTNFPFLFNTTDPDLAFTANGGHVTNFSGNDIVFSADPNGLTKLDHEMEAYNPLTGQVIAWVRIPTLSHTTDTVVYVFYGNPNIVASQQNSAGVWDSNYTAVYHLANSGAGIAADSTVNGNSGTPASISPVSGEIDGAVGFNGASSYIQIPESDFPNFPAGVYDNVGYDTNSTTTFSTTFGVWFKTESAGGILNQSTDQTCTYMFFVCIQDGPISPGDYPDGSWDPLIYINDNGHVNAGGIISPLAYNDNNWHYAVWTFATSGTEALYVDGQNAGTLQEEFPVGYSQGYSYFIGSDFTNESDDGNWGWLYFNGDIDEVTVSDIPRSGDWIQAEFNNQSSPLTFYKLYPSNAVQIVPSAVSLYAIQEQQFSISGSCNAEVNWSIQSGAQGTISPSGLYTAPGIVTGQQSVAIIASNSASGAAIGSAIVTLLPPPSPITLAASAQPPYTTGGSQAFNATVLDQDGTPEVGVMVNFTVTGVNSINGNGTTNSNGVASYTYTGTNSGNDTIQATAVVNGQALISNSVFASWLVSTPPIPVANVTLMAPPALGAVGLVGAFTDNNGAVIEPLAIGASQREYIVPAGATQLQLGVNNAYYVTGGGPGFIVAVNGIPVTVPATAMPWTWVTGGLNNSYQYGIYAPNIQNGILNGTQPVVAATGLTQGESVSIAYQSGTTSANYPVTPLVNADGDQASITGVQLWNGTFFPTMYTTTSSYPLNQPITINAQVIDASGNPMPNLPVTLNISGANVQQLQATTDSAGMATFMYYGTNIGTDSLQAQVILSSLLRLASSQSSVTWTNYPTPPPAGTLALSLWAYLGNRQGYDVVATDASGAPILDANPGFYVWGADNFQLSGTTDTTGHGLFNYYHVNSGTYNVVAIDSVGRNIVFSTPISGQWAGPIVSSPGNTITINISANITVTMPNILQLNGTVTDSAGLTPSVIWNQVSGPGTVTFANPSQASTTAAFSDVGSYVLQLSASDAAGASGSVQLQVTVYPPIQDPQGWIGSPAYGSRVTGVVPITLAPGVVLQSGVLTYYPANNIKNVTVLNAGTIGSGQIGTLDTTMLPNGTYWIQLQATDVNGNQQYGLVQVTVAGNYKPGRVTATVTDLVVPATGLAINIQRTYDSLNAGTSGDFGYGWNLGINVNLMVDNAGNVTFTLGGQRRTFNLTPTMPPCTAIGCLIPFYFVAYTPEPGLHGTLTDSGSACPLDIVVPDGSMWECQDGSQFNPTGYIYTDPNGTAYTISSAGNLQSIQDRSGNGLTITANGITSTTGLNVPFVRDTQNRITQITDPQGNIYSYGYDANGNLATVTYPATPGAATCPNTTASNTSTYTYNANHYYLSGTDGRCNPLPVTAYYDSTNDGGNASLDGRLLSVTDSSNNTTSYAYNLSTTSIINGVSVPYTGVTTITYPDNGTAIMIYDSYGDLLSSEDPLGNTTINAYDANHNLISTTDPLGHTTTATYDANGNKTSSTYPTTSTSHNTTSYTYYNQYSEPISTTDELGNSRVFNYDANYNPQSVTDSIGTLASFIFNPNQTLAAGAIGFDITSLPAMASTFAYDADGNMTSRTDALGRTTSFVYNSLGQKTAMVAPTPTSPTGSQASTTTYTYDALGNLTQTAAPLNRTASSTFDANGNKLSDTDALGHTTAYIYDPLNRLIETDYPDGTKSTRTYDFRNNVLTATDQAGNVTFNTYDAAGRLTFVTRGYGSATPSTTTYAYDADNRKISETDALNHTTTYTYDNAGRLTALSGVKGNFAYAYDDAGNRISQTDANGNKTSYQYDARKRLTKTINPDGTSIVNAYDGPGNLASVTDQAGAVVQYTYDAANQLKTVTQLNHPNTAHNTNQYGYDPLGNLTGLTDERSDTTSNLYDLLNQLTQKTLPDQTHTETRAYDAAGNLVALTHFNGVTTTYSYDALNRLSTRSTPGEPTVSFTYTPTGKYLTSTAADGTVNYTYDSLDRLISKATPEGTLSYTYYASGNVESITSNPSGVSVTYTDDDLNRLSTVVDGSLQGNQTTSYTYDPASNVATVLYPNGLQSSFTYDPMNRLTAMNAGAATYNYQLGPTGNRLSATEGNGRSLTWNYDGIYRLTNETISNDPSQNNGSISYAMDAVGNRLSANSTLPGINPIAGTYNADDEISSETYDANGNVIAAGGYAMTYDAENHLLSKTGNGTVVTNVYDAFGNRVSKTVNGVTTKYLVEDDVNPTGLPQVVEELVNGAVTRQYTYGLQRISQSQTLNGVWTTSFYVYDGAGSVRALTDSTGKVTDEYEYDAYGNSFTKVGTTPNNYLYRGEQYDADLGLYYLRARYYNPSTGRFLSRDPKEFKPLESRNKPVDSRKLHRYLYASGDPVNRIDPLGKSDMEEESLIDSLETYQERSTNEFYRISVEKTLQRLENALDDITCLADCDGME